MKCVRVSRNPFSGIAAFFGAPLDVRHVTLFAGQFLVALSALGIDGIIWQGWVTSGLES